LKVLNKGFVWGCFTGVILTGLLLVGLVGGAVLGRGYFFKEQLQRTVQNKLKAPPLPVGTAPYDWSLTDLDGVPFEMDRTRDRTVVLHFWQPGCLSCLAEVEGLNALYGVSQESMAFDIVAVALSEASEAREAVLEEDIRFPVYVKSGKIPELYQVDTTPMTFIISPGGQVVFKYPKAAQWDDPSVYAFLQGLDAR
jgi:thiol-disulfide isomerase/thioredoxin